MKICFVTEVTYPNYIKRIKESSLKDFIDFGLSEYGIHYYISTNDTTAFYEFNETPFIHVYHIDDLRKDKIKSIKYEIFPEDPKGIYPAKYPWNCRRFIIEKAAIDGFDYVIYIDADTKFNQNLTSDEFIKIIQENFEPKTVQTNSTIFRYVNKTPNDVFDRHQGHINHFGFNFEDDQYDTIDGPCQVFIGETSVDIFNLVQNWHTLSEFGYESDFGYGNNKHGNLSFVIPMSGFSLKWKGFPFYPNHRPEDRY